MTPTLTPYPCFFSHRPRARCPSPPPPRRTGPQVSCALQASRLVLFGAPTPSSAPQASATATPAGPHHNPAAELEAAGAADLLCASAGILRHAYEGYEREGRLDLECLDGASELLEGGAELYRRHLLHLAPPGRGTGGSASASASRRLPAASIKTLRALLAAVPGLHT